jgi:magnesium chelatase family protein
MLAKRFVSILPPMTNEEAIETTKVYSAGGLLRGKLIKNRPFRSPHHSASDAALIGGGASPRPGEVSLAHNGVLFLDEAAEFSRTSLEVLRQPLENFEVTIARARESVSYPARFTLIAAMNPCPCGYAGHAERQCQCSPLQIQRYRSRVSGPLLDRIDMAVQMSPVRFSDWSSKRPEEPSSLIRERVSRARLAQGERFAGSQTTANAFMAHAQIRRFCKIPPDGVKILETAMDKLGMSARSVDKILKVARTVADLEGSAQIRREHLVEVIQYRCLDRSATPV